MIRRYRVEGRVQGVGFRYFTQGQARRLGLSGWVRNTEDGCVEALAAGELAALDTFAQALRQGPRMSQVTHLHVAEVAGESAPEGPFSIAD